MLATKMRDEMTDAGDEEKLDELINEARELQDSLLKKPFTHLEDMLARAYFGLTASRQYVDMEEATAAFPQWEKALKELLTDSLYSLTSKLKGAFRDDVRVPDEFAGDITPAWTPSGSGAMPCVTVHGRDSRRTAPPHFATSGKATTGLSSWTIA